MRRARHPLLLLLAVIVFVQAATVAVVVLYLITQLLVSIPESYVGAIALVVITAAAAVFLVALAASILRARSWVRGAVVTWQILQIAVAIGCFQGAIAQPVVGVALLVPSLAALLLLFTPPVLRATVRSDED